MEEQVAKLLFVAGEPHGHSVMKVVQGLAKSIIEINSDFIDTKMLIQPNIFNIFSGENDLVQRVSQPLSCVLNFLKGKNGRLQEGNGQLIHSRSLSIRRLHYVFHLRIE